MKLMIVDDEADLRDLIAFAVESKLGVETVVAQSGDEAMKLLDQNRDVSGVISDYHMLGGTGGDLYLQMSKQFPAIPFILCTAYQINELPEFKGKTLAGTINKPFRWEELIDTVKNGFFSDEPVNEATDREYFPVKLKTLSRVNVLNCDLYIRLTDSKFVKIIKKGDAFTDKDIHTYSQRDIDCCYIKRTDADTFLSRLTTEVMTLSMAKDLPWNSSCDALQGAYDSVLTTIKMFGFTAEAQELAKAGAKLAIRTIVHLPRLSEVFLKANPADFMYSHSALLAQISCLLASAMGWTSESTQYKLALASFLHDMAIKDENLATFELNFNPSSQVPKDQLERVKKFKQHPHEAATMLDGLKEIPAEISDIILHHHERPDGSGIPLGLTAEQLGALPSLFIVAQDIVYFLWQRSGQATFSQFLDAHEQDYRSGYFPKIAQALRTI